MVFTDIQWPSEVHKTSWWQSPNQSSFCSLSCPQTYGLTLPPLHCLSTRHLSICCVRGPKYVGQCWELNVLFSASLVIFENLPFLPWRETLPALFGSFFTEKWNSFQKLIPFSHSGLLWCVEAGKRPIHIFHVPFCWEDSLAKYVDFCFAGWCTVWWSVSKNRCVHKRVQVKLLYGLSTDMVVTDMWETASRWPFEWKMSLALSVLIVGGDLLLGLLKNRAGKCAGMCAHTQTCK